jgi:hypothetical protein
MPTYTAAVGPPTLPSADDISRGLYALADTWDGGHVGPMSFFIKLFGQVPRANSLTPNALDGCLCVV